MHLLGGVIDAIRHVLSQPAFLIAWGAVSAVSLVVLAYDLLRNNRELGGLMKLVWVLTVLYSGALGLAVYLYSGRKQIRQDSAPRKGFRSVAHCYAGCGAGEIIGVSISVGLFALGQVWVALVTFLFAYVFGLALTVGPLMQDGEPFGRALKDGVVSETASIVVMEAVAVGVDLFIAGPATMGEALFWSSLIVSLSCGLFAAYPVNLLLIEKGVKAGMHNPKEASA